MVAFSTRLAEDFAPIILDPRGYGAKPSPPKFIAYRLIIVPEKRKLCILYEVYWSRQDCTWRKLNKDHNHDYEQIQIHFDIATGLRKLDRKLLEKWYYQHFRDRFGHDISNPFKEPYILYYPPPEDRLSRLTYSLLYAYVSVKRFFTYPFRMLRTSVANP